MRRRTALGLAMALGCGPAVVDDAENTSGDQPTSSARTSGAPTTATSSSDAGSATSTGVMPPGSSTTEGSTSRASTVTTAESSTSASGTGTGDACSPNVEDDTCTACVKRSCCEVLRECRDEPDCDCLITCLEEMNLGPEDVQLCIDACDIPSLNAEAIAFAGCRAGQCPSCS